MSLEWIEPGFSNPSPYYPPLEVRTYNPTTEGRLDTPLTTTGIVDRKALMHLVRSTVVSEYNWRSEVIRKQTTNHHLQWPKAWYDSRDWRNHGSLRTNIAPIAHNWIHDITIPPPLPTKDVQHEYMQARRLADEIGFLDRVLYKPVYFW